MSPSKSFKIFNNKLTTLALVLVLSVLLSATFPDVTAKPTSRRSIRMSSSVAPKILQRDMMLKHMHNSGMSDESIHRMLTSGQRLGMTQSQRAAFEPVPGTVGLADLYIDVVEQVGTPAQRVVLKVTNTGNTIIAASTLVSAGFNPNDSTSGSNADVCATPPCSITLNVTSSQVGEEFAYSVAGHVWNDTVATPYTNGTVVPVIANFALATESTGAFPSTSTLSVLAGQIGLPVNTTECFDTLCYLGVAGALMRDYDLQNQVGICYSFNDGLIVVFGESDSTLYTGTPSCANWASSNTFNITVPAANKDAVALAGSVTLGSTSLSDLVSFGSVAYIDMGRPDILMPTLAYNTTNSILVNLLDPTANTTATTPDLAATLDILLLTATAADIAALPDLSFIIRLNSTANATWVVAPQQYIRSETRFVPFRGELTSYRAKFGDSDVESQGVTVFGAAFFDRRYVDLVRYDQQVCVAPVSSLSCSIGCSNFTTPETCIANSACNWCMNRVTQTGQCVMASAFSTNPSESGASSFYYQHVCNPTISDITPANSAFSASASFWTVAVLSVVSIAAFVL